MHPPGASSFLLDQAQRTRSCRVDQVPPPPPLMARIVTSLARSGSSPGRASREVSAYPILGYCQGRRCGWSVEKSIYSEEYRRLCAILRQLRLDAGLTQVQVAERLGVPQSFVSKYESGERRLDVVELRYVASAVQSSLSVVIDKLE